MAAQLQLAPPPADKSPKGRSPKAGLPKKMYQIGQPFVATIDTLGYSSHINDAGRTNLFITRSKVMSVYAIL